MLRRVAASDSQICYAYIPIRHRLVNFDHSKLLITKIVILDEDDMQTLLLWLILRLEKAQGYKTNTVKNVGATFFRKGGKKESITTYSKK